MVATAEPRHLMGDRRPAPGSLLLVQRLVNTLDLERGGDAIADPDGLAAWLSARGLLATGATLTARDLTRTRALRESIRAMLLAHAGAPAPAHADVEAFDRVARLAPLHVGLDAAGRPAVEPAAAGAAGAWGAVLAAIATATADGTWERLKCCRSETCHAAFYDRSRNASGRWCHLELCGTPAKMRRLRRERRG